MFERFTDTARHVVVQAQADARRLGHNYMAASTCCSPRPRPPSRPARSCATRVSRPNASRRKYCAPSGGARRPTRWAASTARRWLSSASTSTSSAPDRGGVRPGRPDPRPPGRLPEQTASLGEGAARRADAPPASPSRPSRRSPACGPAPATSRFCRARSRRPYPVHAARQEEPGALAARGEGPARQLHRRPAPHPGPARPERRHGTGDPVGPRRAGHIAARRHPRPLPQGELKDTG